MGRGEWPTSVLRELWQALIECESGGGSVQHEARWLNLTGVFIAARLRAGGRRLAL